MFIQYCMLGDIFFNISFSPPAAIERRSLLSFLILIFLSYYLLRKFYTLVFKNLNFKFKSFLIFALSTWFQFLSVQYIGITRGPFKVDKVGSGNDTLRIIEYYSIFGFSRGDCIEYDKCFDDLEKKYGYYSHFLECMTDSEISILEKIFFKKYKIYDKKSIYVLDGIGPFFTLSISENNLQ